jgi:putative hydrolase of the HAD superfamily
MTAQPPAGLDIVFDLGAVLIHWEPAVLVQQHFPQHAPDQQAAAALARDMFGHADWHAFDGGLHSVDEIIARTAQRLALPHEAVHGLVMPLGEHLEPIPETVALLRQLRERRDAQQPGEPPLRLFYLSNMPEPYARVLQRRHEFFQWFDGGIFSGDVQLAKPQPEIFQLLAARHGLAPARTVFIDDALVNVQAARALGWQAIHCTAPGALAPQLLRYLAPGS